MIIDDSIKSGFFRLKYYLLYNGDQSKDYYVMTKQFLIKILFPNLSVKKQQKMLHKAKKLNVWNKNNSIFELVTLTFSKCKNGCLHYCSNNFYDVGDCYFNEIKYTQELLKIEDNNKNYYISLQVLLPLIDNLQLY